MKIFKFSVLLIAIISSIILINSCSSKKVNTPKSQFTELISGYSAGVLSNNSSITVKFMDPVSLALREESVNKDLFSVSPNVKGVNNWVDENTLEYIPNELLNSGSEFDVTFYVDKLLKIQICQTLISALLLCNKQFLLNLLASNKQMKKTTKT
jgi:hypothetical protein